MAFSTGLYQNFILHDSLSLTVLELEEIADHQLSGYKYKRIWRWQYPVRYASPVSLASRLWYGLKMTTRISSLGMMKSGLDLVDTVLPNIT
jgi:hypothetical protein